MKSLIIGGTGFVGKYLARHLKERGHEVAVTGRKQAGMRDLSVYRLNILDKASISELLEKIRPDCIFHLVAQSSVAVSWENPNLTIDINIKGCVNVLEAVRAFNTKTRILLIGSGEEYGEALLEEMPVQEDCRINPGNIYAVTKACQNMIGSIYTRAYGMDVVMVRAFNHIGPQQPSKFVVSDFCRQVAEIETWRRSTTVKVGNLDVKRDFTDVRDIVRAYALLAEHGQAGETYNIGSGHAVSIREILRMILQYSLVDIQVEADDVKFRTLDVPVVEADISKMRRLTGWKPEIALKQTIMDTMDYWRKEVALLGE